MTADLAAGDEIEYVVTYLEMTERPRAPTPPRPANLNTALLSADDPPVAYFLYLYQRVGAAYEWTDRLDCSPSETEAFVRNPAVVLYTLMVDGWPGGFFVLDGSEPGICDLAYFGLDPEAVGRGLGRWFLASAIEAGWERPDTQRMTVNTNTLDHPSALGLYQRLGFRPVRRETLRRTLTRSRTI